MASNPLKEAKDVTLDSFYDKSPDELTDAELAELVALHRAEREAHEERETRKAEKKAK